MIARLLLALLPVAAVTVFVVLWIAACVSAAGVRP